MTDHYIGNKILCNMSHVEYNNSIYLKYSQPWYNVQQQSNKKSTLKLLKVSQFTLSMEQHH